LSGNEYGDTEDKTIAEALRSITNLTKLDLTCNAIVVDVKHQIRALWIPGTLTTFYWTLTQWQN
jgi:hypothetical protein